MTTLFFIRRSKFLWKLTVFLKIFLYFQSVFDESNIPLSSIWKVIFYWNFLMLWEPVFAISCWLLKSLTNLWLAWHPSVPICLFSIYQFLSPIATFFSQNSYFELNFARLFIACFQIWAWFERLVFFKDRKYKLTAIFGR